MVYRHDIWLDFFLVRYPSYHIIEHEREDLVFACKMVLLLIKAGCGNQVLGSSGRGEPSCGLYCQHPRGRNSDCNFRQFGDTSERDAKVFRL